MKRSVDRSVGYTSRLPEAHPSPVSHINLPRTALAALCCGVAYGGCMLLKCELSTLH